MAGAAFLMPGLVTRYSRIEKRLCGIEGRLTRIERNSMALAMQTKSGQRSAITC
ncbi:MAG: hypothetical protein ACM30E_08495 [Nitrososphaerales archaeon]